ncbi:MAG: 2-oxoacid:acceptor oxidoreductase subunit alpha [Asgard group archaeon]|nr:2-oxoacid:acceptor oxidoreductase subunit alpha [Asgard group archaeon]
MNGKIVKKDDISIVLCGAAGLGIQTVEDLLANVLKKSNYHIFATKEYMSRVRGGLNSTEIRVANHEVRAFVKHIDIFFVFTKGAIDRHKDRITNETVIFGETEILAGNDVISDSHIIEVPLTQEAINLGNKVYTNSIAAGIIAGLLEVDITLVDDYFKERFSDKKPEILENNCKAARIGYKIANELESSKKLDFRVKNDPKVANHILLNGTEAIGIGALAGGCNFVCAYPMSPSTAVFTFLAQNQKDFDIIVEQAEDEIAAINAVFGAWYAGARGLATTSGGGFALMEEGISLAGVTEMPLVIHLAQRPGPATGLPTRTEQADLNLALYSGHGEFPRIIFTPGNHEQAFYLMQKAFNLADKYQIPVFVLTDQYLLNNYYNLPPFDLSPIKIEEHIAETDSNYKRYRFTKDGLSPRGIPGGEGLIAVDSHEHDEEGHISEDLKFMRVEMMNKRFLKVDIMQFEIIPPELIGDNDYDILLVCWGSNYEIVKEAIKRFDKVKIAMLHFQQVYPIYNNTIDYLNKAKRLVIIENNFTAQLGSLLQSKFCLEFDHRILKYSGEPFSVEELVEKINPIVLEVQK